MAIFATFKYSRKALNNNYDAWITPHVCERIHDGKVNLVKCKSHNFSHGFNNVGFHGQLEQA